MNSRISPLNGRRQSDASPSGTTTPPAPPQQIDTAVLFAAGPEIFIKHGGDTYRLRVTRQNKLILTK